MQLLLLLALLALGGNKNGQLLGELRPVLEDLGGEELKNALSEAEKLSGVLSAMQSVTAQSAPSVGAAAPTDGGFPLAPIAPFADRDITYSLSRFISSGE